MPIAGIVLKQRWKSLNLPVPKSWIEVVASKRRVHVLKAKKLPSLGRVIQFWFVVKGSKNKQVLLCLVQLIAPFKVGDKSNYAENSQHNDRISQPFTQVKI